MKYVFDTSPFSVLFKNFYRKQFPTLWERFDELVEQGLIVSTREVAREIQDCPIENLREWAREHENLFTTPTAAEAAVVSRIFAVRHFQQNIERQKLYKGGKCADPFVVARAVVESAAVVTMESLRPNSAKIPNICERFEVSWFTLQSFMEREQWEF